MMSVVSVAKCHGLADSSFVCPGKPPFRTCALLYVSYFRLDRSCIAAVAKLPSALPWYTPACYPLSMAQASFAMRCRLRLDAHLFIYLYLYTMNTSTPMLTLTSTSDVPGLSSPQPSLGNIARNPPVEDAIESTPQLKPKKKKVNAFQSPRCVAQ